MATTEKMLDRPLPHNEEAEQAILGGIILQPDLIHQAMRVLKPYDFYVPSNQKTYSVMCALAQDSIPIDQVMIYERLKVLGQTEAVGGMTYLMGLTYGIPHSTNLSHYLEIVRKHSKARQSIKLCDAVQQRFLGGEDPDEVLEYLSKQVSETKETYQHLRRPTSLDEMYDDQALRYMMFLKGVSDAIPTGFPEIDSKLLGGGLVPSFVYVIAGRPSMGKTTLALDIACNMADSGRRVLWVTREMPKASVVDRMVAAKSGIERFKISSGMTKRQYDSVLETLEAMRLVPVVIDDFSETVEELDGWLAEYERTGKRVDALAVDYLQLMLGDSNGNRTNEVSSVSRGFKRLAVKWEIPVIEVSQLKRAPEGSKRPLELSDLRESGQIEQDADFVGFLDGDTPEEGLDFYEREFICRKQREGPLFSRTLALNAGLITFRTPEVLGHGVTAKKPVPIQPIPVAGKANDYEEMHDVKKELDRQKARSKGTKQKKAMDQPGYTFE